MKRSASILLLFIACSTQAQDSLSLARASVRAISDHGYLAVMGGQEFNYAINQLTDYLRAKEQMTVLPESYRMTSAGELEMKAIKAVSSDDRAVWIRAKLAGGNIEYLKIEGYWDYVVDIFVGYYNTTIERADRSSREAVYLNLLTDRVGLSFDTNKAVMKVEKR